MNPRPSGATLTSEPAATAPQAPPPSGSYAASARILSIGIASTGIFTFAYLAAASHVLGPRLPLQPHFAGLGDHVRDPVGHLPADRASCCRARSPTAGPGACTAIRCASRRRSSSALPLCSWSSPWPLRSDIEHGVFDGSTSLYWILVVGVLAYAASYFARGWLAGHERFDLYGGPGLPRIHLALSSSRSRSRSASDPGQGLVGLGMAVAQFASLSVMPRAFSRMRRK